MEFVEKLSHYKPAICGPDGTEHPIITGDDVMFNGDAALGEDHETFHVSRIRPEVPEWAKFDGKPYQGSDYQGYRFCKTNRKPYDTAVVACLIFIANMNKKIMKITSNGSIADWHDGYHLCKAVYPHMNFVIPDLE
jgi:hypothetical protein